VTGAIRDESSFQFVMSTFGAVHTGSEGGELRWPDATAAQPATPRSKNEANLMLTCTLVPPPNGVRLSCAAVVWFSQLQFYYDGRRQLQPLVRLRTDIRRSDLALERN